MRQRRFGKRNTADHGTTYRKCSPDVTDALKPRCSIGLLVVNGIRREKDK